MSSQDRKHLRPYHQPLPEKAPYAFTSHTRYSKPYSLSKFAPKSHLPHTNLKPSKPTSTSGSLQRKSSPSQPTVSQHKAHDLTQPRIRAFHRGLPNPKAAPPDSDIAKLWSEVQAHISTMSGPTATSQMVTDTQSSDHDSQLERTLEGFKVDLEPGFQPQLCTPASLIEAPVASNTLMTHIKDGAEAPAYMVVVNMTFFESPGLPVKNAIDPSDRMNAPSTEKLVLAFQYIPGDDILTAGILFVLAADDTWNGKFQRQYPTLLQKAGLFSPKLTCSDFLAVIGSSDESYKMDSLRKTWSDRAKKALTKQLSIRRADANEDKWEILTRTRYYGYLITGMKLEIREMSYNLQAPPPPPESLPQFLKPKSHSEPGIKPQRTAETTNTKQTTSNIPKPPQKSNPPSRTKSSNPSNPSIGDPSTQTLPFNQTPIKKYNLQNPNDITNFTTFHHALMRWAQAKPCAQYVLNLHTLYWQKPPEHENAWLMSNADAVRYWASATAPPIFGPQIQTALPTSKP